MSAVAESSDRDAERQAFERRRRQRNLALLAALAAFVILIYVVTLVRLGGAPGAG